MIKKVREHVLGGFFKYGNEIYEITKFPTRNSVCGKNIYSKFGPPSSIKTSLKDVTYISSEDAELFKSNILNGKSQPNTINCSEFYEDLPEDIDGESLFFDEDGNLNIEGNEFIFLEFEDEIEGE